MNQKNENFMKTVSKQSSPVILNQCSYSKASSEMLEIVHLTKILESNKISSFQEKFPRVKSFDGHTSEVSAVYISKDASFMISCSKDAVIRIWKFNKSYKNLEIKAETDAIVSLAVMPDETIFATGSLDTLIKIWDLKKKKIICTFHEHNFYAKCLSFSSDRKLLASCSDEYAIYLWDLQNLKLSFKLEGHHGNLNSLCFHPKKNILISCAEDRHFFVWNMTERKVDYDLKGNIKPINCIAINSSGTLLAGAGDTNLIRIYNLGIKAEEYSLRVKNQVFCMQISNKSQHLFSSGSENSITVWCLYQKIELFKLDGHGSSIPCMSLSANGRQLLTGSWDYTLKLWNFDYIIEAQELSEHNETVSSLSLHPNGELLSSGSYDSKICVWNLKLNTKFMSLEYHSGQIFDLCFSPDGQYLSSASSDKSLKILKFDTSELHVSFTDPGYSFISTCFTTNSLFVIAGLGDKSIRMYSVVEKTEIFRFSIYLKPVHKLTCSSDGQFLAYASDYLHLWNFEKKSEIFLFSKKGTTLKSLKFSPDNFYIAGAFSPDKIIIFSVLYLREEFSFALEHESPVSLNYTDDGKLLPSGYQSGLVVVWNIPEKSEEYRINSQTSCITSLILSKDSKNLYTASEDSMVRVVKTDICKISELDKQHTDMLGCLIEDTDKEINQINQTKIVPDTKYTDKVPEYVMIKPAEKHNLEIKSIFYEQHADFFYFYNAIYQIQKEAYTSLTLPSWGVRISNLKFTPLHLAAFKGVTKALQLLIDSNTPIVLKVDALGRSPIYYSITAKHQSSTELLLNFLILIPEKYTFDKWVSSFVAIQNDLPLIIKSSATNLPGFLSKCFYIKDELPVTGIAPVRVKFMTTFNPLYTDFVNTEAEGDKENMRIKACLFEIPANKGTKASIQLIKSIIVSTNKEIFNTQFIRNLILYKWENSIYLIYGYGLTMWFNLVFLVLVLSGLPNFWVFCVAYLNINLMLICWEYFRMRNVLVEYFFLLSNWLSLIKNIISIIWVCLLMAGISNYIFTWIVVLFNVFRGIFGFRAFTTTRYYLQLIIQSTKSIRSFLLIFIYTTFCVGLLSSTISADQEFSIQTLWIDPFGLTVGDTDNLTSIEVNLKYFTFCIAVFINVIVMLNMIISLLGDSFDEFQLNAMYYDFKERTYVVYEIEHIMGHFKLDETVGYLHICVNSDEADENSWQGRVMDLRISIQESNKKLIGRFKKTEGKMHENEEKLNRIENKMNTLIDQVQQSNDRFDSRITKLEESIQSMNKGIQSILNSLNLINNSST